MALRHRLTATLATAVVVGLFGLMILALGLGGPGAVAAPSSHAAPLTHAAPASHLALATAAPKVAKAHPGASTVSIDILNGKLPAYSPGGFALTFNVTTINATVDPTTTNVSVTMYYDVESSRTPSPPYTPAVFSSWAVPVTSSGQKSFSTNVNATNVFSHESKLIAPANSWLTNGIYFWIVNTTIVVNSTFSLWGSAVTGVAGQNGSTGLIIVKPWASLNSPNPSGLPLSPGNETVVASYGGDWVNASTVTITDPNKNEVYSAILTTLAPGNATEVSTGNFLAVTPGEYTSTISLWDLYSSAPVSFTQTFNVTKTTGPSQTVYVNQTIWQNTTGASTQLFGGWSPQQASAILLVVGLIIGMVVALVLGRMMWGGAAAPAPAQAWSASKSANECSVCHQTFASEDELKEHQKTAHGM
jgi:hypothetical protein